MTFEDRFGIVSWNSGHTEYIVRVHVLRCPDCKQERTVSAGRLVCKCSVPQVRRNILKAIGA